MSSIKTLKNKISSVTSTQKVTKAMQLVAASKLHSARLAFGFARRYLDYVDGALLDCVRYYNHYDLDKGYFNVFTNRENFINLLIVFGSEKGLCGSFNSTITKAAKVFLGNNPNTKVIIIGKKIYDSLKTDYTTQIHSRHNGAMDYVHLSTKIAEDIDGLEGVNTRIFVCYGRNLSTTLAVNIVDIFEFDIGKTDSKPIIECYDKDMINSITRQYIKAYIAMVITESKVCEDFIRMIAMDNATRNSTKIINSLVLLRNKTRQSLITRELTEIISGVEALK